jgi:hypothetical protein
MLLRFAIVPRRRRALWLALAALALLVALRAAAPIALRRYVERVIDGTDAYEGSIRDVDLALLRGAYRIEGLDLRRTPAPAPGPFIAADEIDLSIEWRALLHRELVGEIHAQGLVVNWLEGESKDPDEAAEDVWQDRVRKLFPIHINRAVIHDGELHFRAPHREPPVDVALRNVELEARNLTNVREEGGQPASIHVKAGFERGSLDARLDLDPLAKQPDFSLRLAADDVELRALNDFLRAYAGFDVQSGRLQLVTELEVREGRFDGYVKPLIDDLDVVRLSDELGEQSPLATAWEALVGGVAEVFENQSRDQQGTRIPVRGTIDQPSLGLVGALESVLRHAFVDALEPTFEGEAQVEGGEG